MTVVFIVVVGLQTGGADLERTLSPESKFLLPSFKSMLMKVFLTEYGKPCFNLLCESFATGVVTEGTVEVKESKSSLLRGVVVEQVSSPQFELPSDPATSLLSFALTVRKSCPMCNC